MSQIVERKPARQPFNDATGFVRRLGAWLGTWPRIWHSVARQRGRLARLDDRMLADIGMTRQAADAEAARPFWDVPAEQKPPMHEPGSTTGTVHLRGPAAGAFSHTAI